MYNIIIISILIFIIYYIYYPQPIQSILPIQPIQSIQPIQPIQSIKPIENFKCRKSSINNPMQNALLYMSEDELDNEICNESNILIDENLRFNIYTNSNDLYMKENNIRPFITMPSTTFPNKIDNFKNNLYNFENKTCKIDSINCMHIDDVRYHKNYFYNKNFKK